MNINSNYTSIYSFYNNLFQNTMAVYNNKLSSMFKLENKAEPKGGISAATQLYASEIRSEASGLSGILDELTGGSAWNKKNMVSSDSDTMSVKYSGSAYSMSSKEMSVKIDQIASGQVNEGTKLQSGEAYGSTGTNKFTIEIAGKRTDISINAAAGDTNKDIQQKMADAINKAGIGVKASVEVDSETNTSSLKIQALGTGDDAASKFSIKDVIGGAVSKMGADTVTQAAQNAVYSVNGGAAKTSKSNTVDLGNGITATFKKASSEDVTISKGTDKDYAKDAVKDLVKSYNELYNTAFDNAIDDPKAMKLLTKLTDIAKNYSGVLSSVGINVGADGMLSVDSDKLDAAFESGKLESFFTENSGSNFGFANQLGRLADDISRNPSNYVSKTAIGDSLTENFAYTSYGELIQYNYLSAGSIFDYSF